MNDFSQGLPDQDLGGDFVFESDSRSLQQILNSRELSPKPEFKSTLTRSCFVPASMRKHVDKMEFFEGRNGLVFWRNRAAGEGDKGALGRGNSGTKPRLGFGRTDIKNLLPVRMPPTSNSKTPGTGVSKCATVGQPPHVTISRQRICDQKNFSLTDHGGRTFLPKPVERRNGNEFQINARKELKFDQFVKPKSPQKSMAKIIMMRESLAGVPRASLTGLLRQSLTMAELDRMFADDSTESFENLESRLKTPAKNKKIRLRTKDEEFSFAEADKLAEKVPEEVEREQSVKMQKCRSLDDIVASGSEGERVLVLPTSNSEEDLNVEQREPLDLNTSDPFLKQAIENLNNHRAEQAVLEKKLMELIAKSNKRRTEFKAVWGVSPRSINQKRTVKTVLNVQTVKFSDDVAEEEKEPVKDEQVEETADVNELNVSITAELFEKYIDANFSPHPDSKLHNFSGINTQPGSKDSFSLEDICQSLNTDDIMRYTEEGSDNLERIDMELEEDLQQQPPFS